MNGSLDTCSILILITAILMGSISAALSFPVLAPLREESSGMGREGRNAGSYSRTAGGNRAQHFDTSSIMMYRTENKPESENSMIFKIV